MAKFPEPPASTQLARIRPDRLQLQPGTELWRLYFRQGRHPVLWDRFRGFGPTDSRFDHHLPPPRHQQRRILYAAFEGPTCVAEVFQETRTLDRRAREPWLVAFELTAPLELLDLTRSWPTRAGASMALSTGPRARARRWSQAIYEAYPWCRGLLYPASMHGGKEAVALYEAALVALPTHPTFHRPLSDPALFKMLGRVAADLGYAYC